MNLIIADLEKDMAGWTAALGERTAVLHRAPSKSLQYHYLQGIPPEK